VGAIEALLRLGWRAFARCPCVRGVAPPAGERVVEAAGGFRLAAGGSVYTPALLWGRGNFLADGFAFVLAFFVALWPQWVADDELRLMPLEVRRPAALQVAAGGGNGLPAAAREAAADVAGGGGDVQPQVQ